MRWLARQIKLLLAIFLHRSGVLNLLVSRRLQCRVPVLMYHRVIDASHAPLTDSSPGIIVRDQSFEMQMRTLREEFNPISLQGLREYLDNNVELPERSCLVTFDDGWLDNYEIAWPILNKYQIPAVVCLPCNFMSGDSMFWQEEMLMHLTSFLRSGNSMDTTTLSGVLGIDIRTKDPDIDDIRDFVLAQKPLRQEEIREKLQEIKNLSSPERVKGHYNKYISWDQAMEMQSGGISFASHALTHRILTRLSSEGICTELVESKRVLTEQLGTEIAAVAYPNGDHDDRVLSQAHAAGYSIGFSTRSGLFDPAFDNPLAIPRLNMHDRNSGQKALFLCTCADLL